MRNLKTCVPDFHTVRLVSILICLSYGYPMFIICISYVCPHSRSN